MQLWIVDGSYNNLAVADTFSSVVWIERYASAGEFELKIPISKVTSILEYLIPGNYLVYNDSDTYMIIEDVEIKTEEHIGYAYVTGRDLKSILDRRVVSKWYSFDGSMQSMLSTLLNENVINPSDSSRKIPGFSFQSSTDSYITSLEVDTQVLGENLLTLVEDICEESSIGFKVVPVDGGGFKMSLYYGLDRSYDQDVNQWVIFSPGFENLTSSRYYESDRDHKTMAFIGGEGEGAEQVIITVEESGGAKSGLDRKEAFFEINVSRSTDEEDSEGNPIKLTDDEYESQLAFEGAAELSKYKNVVVFDGEADATRQFVYKKDFNMGDVVQVVNEFGLESYARITEVMISEDDRDGFKMVPTFTAVE